MMLEAGDPRTTAAKDSLNKTLKDQADEASRSENTLLDLTGG